MRDAGDKPNVMGSIPGSGQHLYDEYLRLALVWLAFTLKKISTISVV